MNYCKKKRITPCLWALALYQFLPQKSDPENWFGLHTFNLILWISFSSMLPVKQKHQPLTQNLFPLNILLVKNREYWKTVMRFKHLFIIRSKMVVLLLGAHFRLRNWFHYVLINLKLLNFVITGLDSACLFR